MRRLSDLALLASTFKLTVALMGVILLVSLVGKLENGDYAGLRVRISLGDRGLHVALEMRELRGCHLNFECS